MSYCISNLIGIRTGGVFSGGVVMDELKALVAKVVLAMRAEDEKNDTSDAPDLGDKGGDPSHCMSQELTAHKGSYVVIAGVFNYWDYSRSSKFVQRLSAEIGDNEVMHMCWDEESDVVQCQIWLDGKPLFEVNEHPLGRILRRTC